MADPGVQAPLRKDNKATLNRIKNFISSKRFKDVNLIDRLYPATRDAVLSYWTLPGEEGAWQQWTFEEVLRQTFLPTSVGGSFGPTWSTHWFKVILGIPSEWSGKQVRFRWDSSSEATLWSDSGVVLQGLSSTASDQVRTDYVLFDSYDGSVSTVILYVEMAGCRIMGAGEGDLIEPPSSKLTFTLKTAEAAVMDTMVYKLTRDLEILGQLATEMDGETRGYTALFTANQMVNSIIAGDDQYASDLADTYFSKGNGARAHNLAVIGNCHIDTAWLWPFSETKRKIARSFSSQLVLMDRYPDYIFVASQTKVTEGRFLPVGSTWVEMDGNIPSGESFVRQFLHGQRFYEQELGVRCKEYWLPDTFGYSPQIPAIMKHMGLSRFLTQKMSWNFTNKFPHHNFVWVGIDGTEVLAHFPPGESYSMSATVKEARYSESNLQDKGRVSASAFLIGYGDGGGGPTQDQLERVLRLADVDGCPKMKMTTPDELFTTLEAERHNLCKWTGELYLELHNGTYTSQAAMKRLCRAAEFRLRDAEWLLCVASAEGASADFLATSLTALDVAWKKVLLNQFHDVLPGSGIALVYAEATKYYQEAIAAADSVWRDSIASIFGGGAATQSYVFNTLQWDRREVIDLNAVTQSDGNKAKAPNYMLVTVPSFGYAATDPTTPKHSVTLEQSGSSFILSNGMVRAVISSTGQLTSLTYGTEDHPDVFVKSDGEQLAGNTLLLYDDQPLYWDAWDVMDYHLETALALNDSVNPLRCSLSWGCRVGSSSSLTQEISLTADCPYITFSTTVDWQENRKLLKVGFDTGLKSNFVTYDTQFGSLQRPTAVNTSWDWAKYEVCGHKYADLSETDWGFAVLNNSKFGWSGRGSFLSLTLLKSPKAPDDTCDMGQHSFAYAVMPHRGSVHMADVVQRAYEFNNPLKLEFLPDSVPAGSSKWYCRIVDVGIVLHTVKPAEDGTGDIVLRLFECNGTRSCVKLELLVPSVAAVHVCDGMEDLVVSVPFYFTDGILSVEVKMANYSIMALRISF